MSSNLHDPAHPGQEQVPHDAWMSPFVGDEPIDADRWLYVHEGEVVGAETAAAVDLVAEAGLVPQVVRYRGSERSRGRREPGRIRLFIDEGTVRLAKSG